MNAPNLPLFADDGAPDIIAIDLLRGEDLSRLSAAERAWADSQVLRPIARASASRTSPAIVSARERVASGR